MNLGVCLEKGGMQIAIASSNKKPEVKLREKRTNPETGSLIGSAGWYFDTFNELVVSRKIVSVRAKIHYNLSNQQGLITHGYPLGVLGLVCHQHNVALELVTKQKLKGIKLFNLSKGHDPFEWVDKFKDGKPYWDDSAKTACLLAVANMK